MEGMRKNETFRTTTSSTSNRAARKKYEQGRATLIINKTRIFRMKLKATSGSRIKTSKEPFFLSFFFFLREYHYIPVYYLARFSSLFFLLIIQISLIFESYLRLVGTAVHTGNNQNSQGYEIPRIACAQRGNHNRRRREKKRFVISFSQVT